MVFMMDYELFREVVPKIFMSYLPDEFARYSLRSKDRQNIEVHLFKMQIYL